MTAPGWQMRVVDKRVDCDGRSVLLSTRRSPMRGWWHAGAYGPDGRCVDLGDHPSLFEAQAACDTWIAQYKSVKS